MAVRKIGFTVAAVCTFIGGIGAIGAAASSSSSLEPSLGKVPIVKSAQDVSYPLDSYAYPDQKLPVIAHARRVFEVRCMQRLGFAPAAAPHITEDTSSKASSQLLNYLSIDTARQFGYHNPNAQISASGEPKSTPPSIDKKTARLQNVAFTGKAETGTPAQTVNGKSVPSGGCMSEGRRELQKGAGDLPIDPRHLSLIAQEKTVKDPRMHAATTKWSACMKSAGFSYAAPWQTEALARQTTHLTAQEKGLAFADTQCRDKTNVLGVWVAIERAYQKPLIAQNKTKLSRAKKILAIWLANAEHVQ